MVNSGSSTPKNRLMRWWESLTPPSRLLVIALAAPLAVLNAWAFSEIFAYFESLLVTVLAASLLAFLLNYPVSWLETLGVKRGLAALFVFLVALLLLFAIGVTLFPLVLTQAQQLVSRLPEWFDSGRRQLIMLDHRLEDLNLPISLDGLIIQINDRLKGQLQVIASQTLNITLNLAVFTVTKVLDVLLTIISTFYLLQHGREVWRSLIEWLPNKVQKSASNTLRLSFQNYFIGQIIIATCMASGLISLFVLLKVPFGLLFGFTIGVMALVPFGGSVGIALVTLLVALRDIGLGVQVLAVAVVFQQLVENLLAPRIFGSVTGLNPFWVFISLLIGVRVGGLLGVIVAVPTAVVIKEALVEVRKARKDRNMEVTPSAELVQDV
ncbi:AI-2E family transporter [Coleofasciculus sp. B1-GNL1-01]|uniref:AI-2E family transporter n=1 Tax=Coleofasciculus sp. B1-GNL1-01 TaxID=3068484 RepID=UPI00406401F2